MAININLNSEVSQYILTLCIFRHSHKELLNPKVCELDNEATVHNTVGALQVPMATQETALEVDHALFYKREIGRNGERDI